MNIYFSHPAALWALLGLPVVVAIHFLQRRSRRQTITTLFLLQQMRRQSETGNRIERLRLSIPLWLQLLMVLLFAWLLAGPRWLKKDAIQRIAIVMDSSASMQAFRAAAEESVQRTLSTLVGPLGQAELTLWSSDPEAASLYHGTSGTDLRAALRQWEPLLGLHDFSPALRAARSLAGAKGTVLLLTDHVPPQALPFNAQVLSVGQETANVGWAGVTVEAKDKQWFWRALVRNYGRTVQERQWRAGAGEKASAWSNLSLGPGETRSLSGPFIEDVEGAKLVLSLSPDAFTPDDELPVLLPRPKVLALQVDMTAGRNNQELPDLFERFADCRLVGAGERGDVRVLIWPPSVALQDDQPACVFASPAAVADTPFLLGQIVAEDHPLTQGLNWQSLLVREGMVIPRDGRDRVLLWQGERPLISLRARAGGAEQLFCHFNLVTSNARKLPALAVLLHRFLERVRQNKVAPEAANFDLRQRLYVAYQAAGQPLSFKHPSGTQTIPLAQVHLLRAPAKPGFFEVRQGDALLLAGAAHFADNREADLSAAKPFDELGQLTATQQEVTHESDPNWRLWLLVLLGALMGSWWFATVREPKTPVPSFP
jgi:hypothetical protein